MIDAFERLGLEEPFDATSDTRRTVRNALGPQDVEERKDRMNLSPSIDFVKKHLELFLKNLGKLSERPISEKASAWSKTILFSGEEDVKSRQIMPHEIHHLLERMPAVLIELSKLKAVKYATKIPVPGFDPQGNWDKKGGEWVVESDFPRKQDHPGRVLVGMTNETGDTISPTPIPKSASEHDDAVKVYQILVFLHEFFHSIERAIRSSDERKKIILEVDGKRFSFQDWWECWEKLFTDSIEPGAVSRYASNYAEELTEDTHRNSKNTFTHALAEQIAEAFVAYLMNIIPNDQEITDFRQAKEHQWKWRLMDKLCRANVLSVLHIELDEIPEVDAFVEEIRKIPLTEQLARISVFIGLKLKNGIKALREKKSLPPEEHEKIDRMLNQQSIKTLSSVLSNEYGLCVDFHALACSILRKLNVIHFFRIGRIPYVSASHTYLDVLVNGRWQIYDPFADVFKKDGGNMPDEYYKGSYSRLRQG